MSMVRLLAVLGSLGGGGAERVVLNLLRHFDRGKIAPSLALMSGAADYERLIPADLPVCPLGVDRARRAWRALLQTIARQEPDVVFSTAPHMDESLSLAVKLSRHAPKVVLRSPNYPSLSLRDAPVYVRRLAKWSYQSADRVVATTQEMKEDMEREFGLDSKRISVIPNPVDLEVTRDLSEEPVSHPWFSADERAEHPVILGMGRLEPQKGFSLLLDALAEVKAATGARLVILGKGSELSTLRERAAKLGIAQDVEFLGFQGNPYKFVAKASLFVLPSLWEGFPNALVEAMACGIPVVSTDCRSGPREIIQDGVDGVLVPPADVGALAKGVLRVLDNGSLAGGLARAGETRVADFEVRKIAARYQRVFEAVLGG